MVGEGDGGKGGEREGVRGIQGKREREKEREREREILKECLLPRETGICL